MTQRNGCSAVLAYHRVAHVESDPWALAVAPARFDEHLEVLRHHFRPLPLLELVNALRRGQTPSRGVVVTFDDGYGEDLITARSSLERHGVPATIFVVSGYLGFGRFWWDDLAEACLVADGLPTRGEVTVGDSTVMWDLDRDGRPEGVRRSGDVRWRAWQKPESPRQELFHSLWELLVRLPYDECAPIVDDLRRQARLMDSAGGRALTAEEVGALASHSLFEIGAHSVTHPALAELPRDDQLEEIRGSRSDLEAMLGRPVQSFSYPFSRFTPETVSCVQEAGFSCAVTTEARPITGTAEPLELPRLQVQDWPAAEFERELLSLLEAA